MQRTLKAVALIAGLTLAQANAGLASDDEGTEEKTPPIESAPPPADADDAAEPATPDAGEDDE